MKQVGFIRYQQLTVILLRVALVSVLGLAGWQIYKKLPPAIEPSDHDATTTTLQIVMRNPNDDGQSPNLGVAVDFYPVDIVAVQHEYFTERRPGTPYWEFFKEKMKGRVTAQLDKEGHGSVKLTPGSWWLHATLTGDEELEWRLPVSVTGTRQIVELTSQNAYTRSKSF